MLRHIPNALTVLRLVLAAAFPFVDADLRIAVLIAALATEFFDGVLARWMDVESRFGRILDPIADRCLFASVAITLLLEAQLAAPTLAALGARDVLVGCGALWIIASGDARVLKKMAPHFPGKLTTALQYVALLCVVFEVTPPLVLVGATGVIGLYAAWQYLKDSQRLRRG